MINVYSLPREDDESEEEYFSRVNALTYHYDNEKIRRVENNKIYLQGTIEELEIHDVLTSPYPELTDINPSPVQTVSVAGEKIELKLDKTKAEDIIMSLSVDNTKVPDSRIISVVNVATDAVLSEALGLTTIQPAIDKKNPDKVNLSVSYRPKFTQDTVKVNIYKDEGQTLPEKAVKVLDYILSREDLEGFELVAVMSVPLGDFKTVFNDPCALADIDYIREI